MNRSLLRQLLLYRYRYIVGIIILIIALVGLLLIAINFAPNGVSNAEMQSATKSAAFHLPSLLNQSLIDFPYVLLQKVSLQLFGLSSWSIAAPSLIIATITGIIFVMMMQRWFRLNVALTTGIILATSAPFLTLGRSGTAGIMTLFWISLILLAATNILHKSAHHKIWQLIAVLAIPISLYTPLMIYPLIALGIAGLLHPHVRFMLIHGSKKRLFIGLGIFILLFSPLVWSIIQFPRDSLILLGLPEKLPTWTILSDQLMQTVKIVGNFTSASIGEIPHPLFGAATLLVIIFGFLRTVADHHSARSYMLFLWILLIIPPILLTPNAIISFIMPAFLLLAIGIESLIREWYKLFPLNPYARIVGLIPLTILLGGIMVSNTVQYFYGHFYSTPTTQYSQNLTATRNILDKKVPKNTSYILYVKPSDQAFYSLLKRDYKKLTVSSTIIAMPPGTIAIAQDGLNMPMLQQMTPTSIKTSYLAGENSALLRTYTLQ